MGAPVMIIDGSLVRIKIHAVTLRREEIAERAETDSVSFLGGQAALDYLVAHPRYIPTVILLDDDLPKIQGRSVLHWLRTVRRLDATAIIVFSKQADAFRRFPASAKRWEGMDLGMKHFNSLWDTTKKTLAWWHGANHVLQKPFKTGEVVALVSQYLALPSVEEQEKHYSSNKGGFCVYSSL